MNLFRNKIYFITKMMQRGNAIILEVKGKNLFEKILNDRTTLLKK